MQRKDEDLCAFSALRYSFRLDKSVWMVKITKLRKNTLLHLKVELKSGVEECWGVSRSEGRKYDSRTLKLTWWIIHTSNFGNYFVFLFLFCISLCKVPSSYEIKVIIQEIHSRLCCYVSNGEDSSQGCGTSARCTVGIFISRGGFG